MKPSEYWNAWFDTNCPKIPSTLKLEYVQALSANDVKNEKILKEWLDIDDNYLESINISNKSVVKSIKVFIYLFIFKVCYV